ncbi:Wzz/FepE/Etk N-terminal domain-containing protein [Beijerinckia sp. L45]|uniref:Wzz/FepE/Etk N-terminal domain-containing protein n=1 Tax=Beijerinckia sp. L45 TaxID=1641855 RepID=UPI00131B3B86|nr:Wzz/FepE/Etk N-terminal domain-containing protein [Beijerinckia sp. L45]
MERLQHLETANATGGSMSSHQTTSPHFDMRALAATIRRHSISLIAWMLACWFFAGVYIAITPAEFTAATQIIFKPTLRQRTTADSDNAQATLDSAQADSRLQVIKSERLLRLVFDTLHLGPSPSDQPPPKPFYRRILARLLGRSDPTPSERYTVAFLDFMNRVAVRRIGLSYVVEASFRSTTALQAAHVANSITAAYIRDSVLSGQRDTEMLQRRIIDVKDENLQLLDAIRNGEIPAVDFADADARVISAAIVPLTKSYPQSTLIVVFATALGLLTGLSASLVRHNTDRTIRTRRDVFKVLGLRCLASIPGPPPSPFFRKRREVAVGKSFRPEQLAALSPVIAEIAAPKLLGGNRAIGIVSLCSGEGTSWVAYNLSILLGSYRENVVLVDANGPRPALSKMLAANEKRGFGDAVLHSDPINSLLHVSVAKGVRFVPFGDAQSAHAEIYPAWKVKLIVDELKTFGHVLIDFPAITETSSLGIVGRELDGVICVVEAGRCASDDVNDAIQILNLAGVPLIGVILNKTVAPMKRARGAFELDTSSDDTRGAAVGFSDVPKPGDACAGFPVR